MWNRQIDSSQTFLKCKTIICARFFQKASVRQGTDISRIDHSIHPMYPCSVYKMKKKIVVKEMSSLETLVYNVIFLSLSCFSVTSMWNILEDKLMVCIKSLMAGCTIVFVVGLKMFSFLSKRMYDICI